MKLAIQTEQEDDGRWIAEVVDLAGVAVYGAMREEAIHAAQALAFVSWRIVWKKGNRWTRRSSTQSS
jgi:hypothetical protein